MTSLGVSNICSAFHSVTIGSRVTDAAAFFGATIIAVERHDFSADRVPGQAVIEVPNALPYVSSGVGRKSSDPDAYVCREHRGVVSAYLKRQYAEKPTNLSVVVYTIEAYERDPDVTIDELERLAGCTHVIVAVLASVGAQVSPLSPYRLVWNLAGGNREADLWTADEIRERARAAIAHDCVWSTVAD